MKADEISYFALDLDLTLQRWNRERRGEGMSLMAFEDVRREIGRGCDPSYDPEWPSDVCIMRKCINSALVPDSRSEQALAPAERYHPPTHLASDLPPSNSTLWCSRSAGRGRSRELRSMLHVRCLSTIYKKEKSRETQDESRGRASGLSSLPNFGPPFW